MKQEHAFRCKPDDNPFSASLDAENALAGKLIAPGRPPGRPQFLSPGPDPDNALTYEKRAQVADNGLDFRKLGHEDLSR
jgi:hypothetical protein